MSKQRSSSEKLWATALSSGQGRQDNEPQVRDYWQVSGSHSELRPGRAKTEEQKKQKQNKTCSLTGPARKTQGPWPFACYCHNCWIMTPYHVHFPHLHTVSQVSYITYIYTNLSQTLCLISLKWGTETLFLKWNRSSMKLVSFVCCPLFDECFIKYFSWHTVFLQSLLSLK